MSDFYDLAEPYRSQQFIAHEHATRMDDCGEGLSLAGLLFAGCGVLALYALFSWMGRLS